MIISLAEIIDIFIMTFAIGYIFSDYFKREPLEGYDPLKFYRKSPLIENIKFAAMITAPAVVFHELAHKFVALSFGATATLHAPYGMYAIVILLKMMRFPLLFFVGGYVSHTPLPALQSALVSVAGPLTNLILWLAAIAVVKYSLVNRKYYKIIVPMGKINMFLCIFNMLPLPGFDGFHFISSIFQAFF
jgi:Zn-dependent protease